MDINRKTAYKTLLNIEMHAAYSNIELFIQIKNRKPDSPAFVRELVYGVLENKRYLDYLLEQLLSKGLKGLKKQPLIILRMGLYQLMYMDSVPEYAAVNESVQLARKYCFGQAGLVNGVLRNFTRRKDKLKDPDSEPDPITRLSYKYSFSSWIVKLWLEQYGEERAEVLMKASNMTPPIMIRVNPLKISTSSLTARLEESGVTVTQCKLTDRCLIVAGKPILGLQEYKEGLFSIQDEASMIAMETLAPKKGDLVIDVCAAPGGKCLACGEIMGGVGRIIAFDLYEKKVRHLKAEAKRLDVNIVEAEVHDAMKPKAELAGQADAVICDVPCTGLGVVRRRPEIKYKDVSDSGEELARKQLAILEASATYVKKGGYIMYSTCTINAKENRDVVGKFLRKHDNFDLIRNRQLSPSNDLTDGFYFCKMKKRY